MSRSNHSHTKTTSKSDSETTLNETSQREEQEHFRKVVEAFAYYPIYSEQRLQKTIDNVNRLSYEHKKLIPHMHEKVRLWRNCIEENSAFIEMICSHGIFLEENPELPSRNRRAVASDFNMDKVCSTIRQFNREWGAEGAEERKTSYGVLLEALESTLPVDKKNPYKIKVLCPGSGLGRLPLEICRKGYCSQGNEYSYFMLITGNFMLNNTTKVEQYTVYPFIHQISNVAAWQDQFRPIKIPDISPGELPPNADFSYTAGDFVEVYSPQKESWDAIVTCFFLDTANNIIQFVEIIYHILKPGGWWFNFGPLLYHYADLMFEQSIELSQDELINVVTKVGFVIEKQTWHNTKYAGNIKSMMHVDYNAAFFSARKPEDRKSVV